MTVLHSPSSLSLTALGTIAAALLTPAAPATAGPPYVTDDPVPAEPGHWEIFGFASGADQAGETERAAGFDINYGLANDLQLTMVIPFESAERSLSHGTMGEIELGLKYRIVRQRAGSLLPDVAIFPSVRLPTGSRRRSSGRGGLFLPVWLQKDFGPWSLFGGGGYSLNAGPDRNTGLAGLAISRQITARLRAGGEIYLETAEGKGERSSVGVGVGLTYDLSSRYALVLSGGPQRSGGVTGTNFYAGIELRY